MTARYKPYPEYKPSGVEWLGDVPQGWMVKKMKYLCRVQTGDKDTVNAIDDGIYPFFVRSQTVERINSFSFNCEAVFTAGDGVGVGKVFHHYTGPFDFHQRVYMMNRFQYISGRFFFYYFREQFAKVALEGRAKSTVDSLRMPLLMDFPFTTPSQCEQRSIAEFLDRETGKINRLIEKQERMIVLLKEKRQAVISQAVTKGLDPAAPMKDSGIEWLGDVPECWDLCLIKHKLILITDGAHISPETENGQHYFVSIKDMEGDQINFSNALLTSNDSYKYLVHTGCKPKGGDVLFSKDGTIGKTTVVKPSDDFVIASSLIILRPDNMRLLPRYLHHLCQGFVIQSQVNSFVKGAALMRLSLLNLSKVWGTFPPEKEQEEISKYIDNEASKIDNLIAKSAQAIELMKERRTALISAAVTGKIDVREAT